MPVTDDDRYDVASVRGLYTSLGDGWTYLNAHDSPQVPERVSSAVARSFRTATAVSRPEPSSGSHARPQLPGRSAGASFIDDARLAVADLVGGSAGAVVLGPSLPVLYSLLADAMRPLLRYQSSIVLSGLDSETLSRPLANAVSDVRWAKPDLGTGELPGWQYRDLVDGSTRLVAFSAAHGLLGTVAPVASIVETARENSRAWVLVDASSYAAYRYVDIDEWNADIIAVDLGQLGGPQLAALVFRDEAMFKRLRSLHPRYADSDVTAGKLMTPISPGLAGGVSPTVDHLAGLVPSQGSRRKRLAVSMTELDNYLGALRDDLVLYLGSLSSVHILGLTGEAASGANEDRIPRLSFGVRGVPADMVQHRLYDNGLVTTLAPAMKVLTEMGADEIGGAITVALGPFTTSADIDHLVRVVASLA